MYFHMHILSILVLLVLPIRPQAHSIRKPQNQAMQNSVKSKDKWCLQRKLPVGKSNCYIGNKQRRRKMGGMRVEVEDVAFLLVILKSYGTGQKGAWMTVFQIIPVNRDFTGNVYRLIGHFDFFFINIFMKCFYIFKLFHTEGHFCSFTEIYNY